MEMNFYNSQSNNTNNNNETNEQQQSNPITATTSTTSSTTTTATSTPNNPLKRNLKLDFNSATHTNFSNKFNNNNGTGPPNKRPKIILPLDINTGLSSPDLKKLNLTSPELEKFITQNISLTQTPTPNQLSLFSNNINEEAELYARGFVQAMKANAETDKAAAINHTSSSNASISSQLINENSSEFVLSRCSSNSSGATYTTLDSSNPPFFNSTNLNLNNYESDGSIKIKEEPLSSIASSSPPMSPINMENQEIAKLERKRQRNRVAASKCRKRKLQRITDLEAKVKNLKSENSELANVSSKLKQQVCILKQQVLEHIQSGCHMELTHNF